MPVQLTGIGVTLPSVRVSLTPATLAMPWSGESLIGGVSISTATSTSAFSPSLDFSKSTNSMYIPLVFG